MLEDKQITMRGIQIAVGQMPSEKMKSMVELFHMQTHWGKHLARSTGLKKRTLYGMKKYGGRMHEALTAYAQAY